MEGLSPIFSAHVRWGERGAPVHFLGYPLLPREGWVGDQGSRNPIHPSISSEICGLDMIAVLGLGWVSLPLAEGQAGREEAAGEKGGEAGLHPVVMEDGQQAVNAPGDASTNQMTEPRIAARLAVDTASMQQIHFPVSMASTSPAGPRVRLRRTTIATTAPPRSADHGEPMRRLVSLDVARGITIAFMILVNNGGSGKYSYRQLEHSAWNGWTLTDLVFPSFLFIAGISIVFSTESRLARGESKGALRLHVLKRAVILFLPGAGGQRLSACFTWGRCASTACCNASRSVSSSPAFFTYGTAGPG
jgi:hypothetical protein